jgi:hypothetical protein
MIAYVDGLKKHPIVPLKSIQIDLVRLFDVFSMYSSGFLVKANTVF